MNQMERLLHYVWKYKLYTQPDFVTADGQTVSVIDPGITNPHTGPDFFNAKIKIGTTIWVGNVDLHLQASDWNRDGHNTDCSYDSVILHVVTVADMPIRRTNGEIIPQIQLAIPDTIQKEYLLLTGSASELPCAGRIGEIDRLFLLSWMEALVSERMEQKTGTIFSLLSHYRGDWNEVFYIVLARNFGFGINSDAFEWLARSLPFRCIQKHRDSPRQVEALFFGQAGMLDEQVTDEYYFSLQQEYRFLQHKFSLIPMEGNDYKSQRVRPGNFPHIKLAQLAALWTQRESLFSEVLYAGDMESLRGLFRVSPSPYWDTHYHFRYASVKKQKLLGENALNILLINTVAPILFAYGTHSKRPEYNEKALSLLEKLPPESNRIVSLFRSAGFTTDHAADSQALIQLKRSYCEKKKCLYCRIGFKLLQRK